MSFDQAMTANSDCSSGPPSPSSKPQSPSLHIPTDSAPRPSLPAADADIAHALVAWLVALSAVPLHTTFDHIAANCVPLCRLFSRAAPALLSPNDFFQTSPSSGPNVTRNRRYNFRRLARALSTYFHLRTNRPNRSTSSSQSSDLSTESEDALSSNPDSDAIATASLSTFPQPRLTPRYAHDLLALAESTFIEPQDVHYATLTLAECTLCAATSCVNRDTYIQAVLTLPQHMQDLLAVSMSRTMQPPHEADDLSASRPPLHDSPVRNDENRVGGSHITGHDDRLVPPAGIPLNDYKALASERDALRRKVNALHAEIAQLQDLESTLRKDLEDAHDHNREVDARFSTMELELAEKNRKLTDAEDSVRDAKVKAEEFEVLRIKAQSVEELEASLKRVNERLEEMNNLRVLNTDLETQIQAFHENEGRLSKHTEYLEGQLERTTERVNQLSSLVDEMTVDLESKDSSVAALRDENDALKEKIVMLNAQLEVALQQATASMSRAATSATTRSQPSLGSNIRVADQSAARSEDRPGAPEVNSTTTGTQSTGSEEPSHGRLNTAEPVETEEDFDRRAKQYISDLLLDALGMRVSYGDIVECFRGVMDAMRDMEQSAELEHRAAAADSSMAKPAGLDRVVSHRNRPSAEAIRHIRSSNDSLCYRRNSHQSIRSDGRVESGSDAFGHLSFVPEFGELDAKLKAKNSGRGDEFDHAANYCNVKEILAGSEAEGMARGLSSNDYDHESSSYTHTGTYDDEDDRTYDGESSQGLHTPHQAMVEPSTGLSTEHRSSDRGVRQTSVGEGSSSQSGTLRSQDSDLMTNRESTMNLAGQTRNTSMSLTIRGAVTRSTSHSETTSVIARQTRSDLRELQRAVEAMRFERQSCLSVSDLVHKLEAVRMELDLIRKQAMEAEAEGSALRTNMNTLLTEMDAAALSHKLSEERGRELVKEKDRLIAHLEASMRKKENEVNDMHDKYSQTCRDFEILKKEEKTLKERLQSANVIERAHEIEIAKLRAKLETTESVESHLTSVVRQTEGFTNEMIRQRDNQMSEMVASVRREKELAEQAREELRRVAKSNENVLQDVRAGAAAVALARSASAGERPISRRSTRFYDFWRRLLHRERSGDFSTPNAYSSAGPILGDSPITSGTPRTNATPRGLSIPRSTAVNRNNSNHRVG